MNFSRALALEIVRLVFNVFKPGTDTVSVSNDGVGARQPADWAFLIL